MAGQKIALVAAAFEAKPHRSVKSNKYHAKGFIKQISMVAITNNMSRSNIEVGRMM